ESFVLRALAGRLTPEQVARVEANLEAQHATIAPGDYGRCVELDTEFHLMFCEFLGNREILRVMLHLRDAVYRVMVQVYEREDSRLATSYQEHRAIAEAVIRGDAAEAARRIEDHLEYGKRALLSTRRG